VIARPQVAVIGYFGEGNFGDDLILHHVMGVVLGAMTAAQVVVSVGSAGMPAHWFPGVHRAALREIAHIAPAKIVFGGGGTIYALPPATPANLWGLLSCTALGYWKAIGPHRWRRARSYAYCLGVGPLAGCGARWVTRRFMRQFERVSVRDPASTSLLSELGVANVTTATDPACAFATPIGPTAGARARRVGIIFRQWENTLVLQRELVVAARQLRQRAWDVELISLHPAVDAPAIEFFESNGDAVRRWRPDRESTLEFCRYLGSFGVLITMRGHGLLAGAMAGAVPVAVRIEPKLQVFAEQWGQPDLAFDPSASAGEIASMVEKAALAPLPQRDWSRDLAILDSESKRLREWLSS
jgi:polysaccharide pyruvyl transferase WcaK-like protein